MEVTKWLSEDYAWLLHRGTGGGMSPRKAYATREDDTRDRLGGGISLACARAFASAGPTSCSTVWVQPPRSRKLRYAMENDFGVKSVDSPATQCGGLAAKANQRASMTGEDRD